MDQEFMVSRYKLYDCIQITNKDLLYSTGTSTQYSGITYQKRILQRMDICTCITASLCCAPENNIVNQLYFNKIKKFLKRACARHTMGPGLQRWVQYGCPSRRVWTRCRPHSEGPNATAPCGRDWGELGHRALPGGLEGLRELEDEQGFVRWDVMNVNIADALNSSIKQVLLSSQQSQVGATILLLE